MTTAAICTIGDEILIGQIVDTNSSMISRALGSIGIRTKRMISVGDDEEEIIDCLSKALGNNDIVVVTGGLGPTKDDITKAALARLTGSRNFVTHEGQLKQIGDFLSSRGLAVLDVNRAQACVPDNCEVIVNHRGTAPIMVFRLGGSTLYSMPGVPFETEAALPDVLEDIKQHYGIEEIFHRTVMTYGLAESALSKLIEPWEDALPEDIHLAYLPSPLTGVRLRLSIYGGSEAEDTARVDAELAKLREILGSAIYSEQDDTLEHAVGKLLKERRMTVSVAESCTGGEIAHLITTVPGSSDYFLGSVTSYAISVKEAVLGVPGALIEKHGVVSAPVAKAMAEGVKRLTGSDFSVATTGFADSTGDEHEGPGTVWIAVSGPQGTKTRRFIYHNDRKRNIERFASSALFFLLTEIKYRG